MRNRLGRGPAVMTFLAVELLSSQVGAGASLSGWQLIGPPGGSVRALVTDPRQPATIYAGGRNGICRSLDAGQSWTPINNGLTHRSVISIAIDPSDSSRLYVGTDGGGLFKSEDGGGHWLDTNQGLRSVGQRWWAMSVWSIAVHPKRSKTILIGVETVQEYTGQPDFAGSVLRSIDGGRTWISPQGFPLTRVSALAFDPKDPSVVYAGTFRCGVMKSTDGGDTWSRLTAPDSLDVRALRVAPTSPATIYAASLAAGVYRSIDGGATWHAMPAGLTDSHVMDVLVDPENPKRVFAAAQYDGVFESQDGGEHWNWISPFLRGAGPWTLAISPNPGGLLAGTYDDGVFQRGPHGASEWTPMSSGLTNTGVSQLVSAHSPGYLVVRGSVLWSRGPTGWSIRGTLPEGTCSGAVVHVTSDPRRLYAQGCGSWGSDDGGANWTKLSPSTLGNTSVLAADPRSPQRIYAANDKSFSLSDDGGSTWRRVGTPGLRPEDLVVDGTRQSRLWVRSATELRRSDDGGKTWRSLELPAPGRIEAFSVVTESALLVITEEGLFRSVDGGSSWTRVLGRKIDAVAIDPVADRHVIAATMSSSEMFGENRRSEIFESVDGGQSWSDITGNLRSEVTSIDFDRSTSEIVVAGTQGLATLRVASTVGQK